MLLEPLPAAREVGFFLKEISFFSNVGRPGSNRQAASAILSRTLSHAGMAGDVYPGRGNDNEQEIGNAKCFSRSGEIAEAPSAFDVLVLHTLDSSRPRGKREHAVALPPGCSSQGQSRFKGQPAQWKVQWKNRLSFMARKSRCIAWRRHDHQLSHLVFAGAAFMVRRCGRCLRRSSQQPRWVHRPLRRPQYPPCRPGW